MEKIQNKIQTIEGKGEWILTNGIGGYALGCIDLINRRKYHGLLIASSESLERISIITSVEEKIIIGENEVYLDSNNYGDVIYPEGYKYLIGAWLRPYPIFLYRIINDNNSIFISKEIMMANKVNTTLLRYTNLSEEPVEFSLRYKFSLRNHHHINYSGSIDEGLYREIIKSNVKKINGLITGWARRENLGLAGFIYSNIGEITKNEIIFRKNWLELEYRRGYDHVEDLYSPILHTFVLKPLSTVNILISDATPEEESKAWFNGTVRKIISKYINQPKPSNLPLKFSKIKPTGRASEKGIRFVQIELDKKILNASLHFKDTQKPGIDITSKKMHIFQPDNYRNILDIMLADFRIKDNLIAGYPWFSAWGRDTMIALETYTTFSPDIEFSYKVLEIYGQAMKNGVIPNVIGEDGKGTNYDTVDASLWFIIRAYEIFDRLSYSRMKSIFSFCSKIVLNYIYNPALPFFLDTRDNLISIKNGINSGLTWMDAKVNNRPITPRYGKPVEINALWYNSVAIIIYMSERLNKNTIKSKKYTIKLKDIMNMKSIIKESMKLFFDKNTWYDRIELVSDQTHREQPYVIKKISEIRPNFIIACSLPFDFAPTWALKLAQSIAEEKLLTVTGLRSLAEDEPGYNPSCTGDQTSRDLAYHNGTIWTWLLLPYAKLVSKTAENQETLKEKLKNITHYLRNEILAGNLASVPEIWDGGEPQIPRGAPAQAWSVTALYCIEKMIEKAFNKA